MSRFESIRRAGLLLAGLTMLTTSVVAQKVDLVVYRMKQNAATLMLGTLEVQRCRSVGRRRARTTWSCT